MLTLLRNHVEAVFNFEGTLDKFIGDALDAGVWCSFALQNHAWAAFQSALDMRRRLQQFNQDRFQQNQPEIRIGIGISSGKWSRGISVPAQNGVTRHWRRGEPQLPVGGEHQGIWL
jgi:class 3 adenylate cyclase